MSKPQDPLNICPEVHIRQESLKLADRSGRKFKSFRHALTWGMSALAAIVITTALAKMID